MLATVAKNRTDRLKPQAVPDVVPRARGWQSERVKGSLQDRASAHAVVAVADLSQAKAFYSDVLGLIPYEDRGSAVRYEMGGGTWFLLYQSEHPQPTGTTRLRFEVDDVRDVVEQLKTRGVVFEEYDLPGMKTVNGIAEHPSGARGAWFKDPDGNILQIGQYPSWRPAK